ncbi:hypothetical protein KUTeg_005952, partial [Tegillarca granosa]
MKSAMICLLVVPFIILMLDVKDTESKGLKPYYFGTTDVFCMLKHGRNKIKKRDAPRRYVLDIKHRWIYFDGWFFERLADEDTYGERPDKYNQCKHTMKIERYPAGYTKFSVNCLKKFTDKYRKITGSYNLLTNNCHHFANTLVYFLTKFTTCSWLWRSYYFGTTDLICMNKLSSRRKRAAPWRSTLVITHRWIYYDGWYFERFTAIRLTEMRFANRAFSSWLHQAKPRLCQEMHKEILGTLWQLQCLAVPFHYSLKPYYFGTTDLFCLNKSTKENRSINPSKDRKVLTHRWIYYEGLYTDRLISRDRYGKLPLRCRK